MTTSPNETKAPAGAFSTPIANDGNLVAAVSANDAGAIDAALADGCDINERIGQHEITPIMLAAEIGADAAFDCLLRQGANLTLQDRRGRSLAEFVAAGQKVRLQAERRACLVRAVMLGIAAGKNE